MDLEARGELLVRGGSAGTGHADGRRDGCRGSALLEPSFAATRSHPPTRRLGGQHGHVDRAL